MGGDRHECSVGLRTCRQQPGSKPRHHTPQGVVHGGVQATAVESAAGIGAPTAVADRGQFAIGVHKATDFRLPRRSTVTAIR